MSEPDLAKLRREYGGQRLDEQAAGDDPLKLFARWFDDVLKAGLLEPNAMALATTGPDGQPAARMVLLKGFDERGFTFYSNYRSRKGRELDANPRAALLFWWPPLERQVRIEGRVEKTSPAESDAYFAQRPRLSQLAAAVSPQSEPIGSRLELERAVFELERKYFGQPIPRPEHWGGYRLRPRRIEFWQGGENRVHDRLLYELEPDGSWKRTRLAP